VTADDDAEQQALGRLLDAVFEFACERRVDELIAVEPLAARVLAAIDTAATPSRLERLMARFVVPARQRALERAQKSALPFGAWLPEPARDAIAALLAHPAPIPRALVDKVVADEHVRESVRAMLYEALQNFIQKAFSVAPGGRGLRGVIGFGARAAGGLFGGIGEELQRHLEERVRDFVDSGVKIIQQQVVQRVVSEDTARLIGKRRRAIFLDLLKQPESEAARLAKGVPFAALDALVPSIVVHNLARQEVRAALRDEIAAVVAELSTQTIGELLDELGLRQAVREALQAHGLPLVLAFIASPQFARLQTPAV
jgi:hypothetical protein